MQKSIVYIVRIGFLRSFKDTDPPPGDQPASRYICISACFLNVWLAVLLGKLEKSVPRRNPGTGRAARAKARDVVKTLKQLSDQANTPRFRVQSDGLPRIAPLLG